MRRAPGLCRAAALACAGALATCVPAFATTGDTVADSTGIAAGSAAGGAPARVRRAPNVLAWPVYVRWDSENGNSVRVVGPVTTLLRTRREHSFYAIFPTTGLRRLHSGRTELDLAWPLTSLVRDPARGMTAVRLATPLLGYERRADERVRSVKLSPVFADERHSDGRRRFEIAPFHWRSDDPARLREAREYGYLPLLGGGGLSLLRTWSTPDARGWSSTILAGAAENADTRWRWLFPYLSYERSSGDGVPTRFRTFGGVWSAWESAGGRGWEFALLWSGSRNARGSWLSLPPWFSATTTDSTRGTTRFRTLAPLWARWQSPATELQLALPSIWHWRSERLTSTGAWPLFASFRRTRADSAWRTGGSFAWPFVSWGRGEGYAAFGVLPLYYRVRDGATSLTLVPPVYASYRRGDRDLRVLLPLWYARSDPRARLLVVPGWLDWRSVADDRRTIMAGPVVMTRGRDSRGFGVVPAFYTGSWPGGGAGLAGPLFWKHGPRDERAFAVLPLAWYARARGTTDLFLLPLTGFRRHDDGRERTWVLWPLYTHRTWAEGRTRHSLLLGLGRDERSGAKRRAWLQPLFYYDRPSEESSWFATLGGLLTSYERNGRERRLRVLMIPVRTWTK